VEPQLQSPLPQPTSIRYWIGPKKLSTERNRRWTTAPGQFFFSQWKSIHQNNYQHQQLGGSPFRLELPLLMEDDGWALYCGRCFTYLRDDEMMFGWCCILFSFDWANWKKKTKKRKREKKKHIQSTTHNTYIEFQQNKNDDVKWGLCMFA
jgi:hypothetical protein